MSQSASVRAAKSDRQESVTRKTLAPEDIEFHERVLRLTKGIVKAYEQWLEAKKHQLS